MSSTTGTATISEVLALTRTLSESDRQRLTELLVRDEEEPLPEHATIDEAIELYLAEACSLGRAAELAGVTRWDVMDRMNERDIPIYMPGAESAEEMGALAERLRSAGIL